MTTFMLIMSAITAIGTLISSIAREDIDSKTRAATTTAKERLNRYTQEAQKARNDTSRLNTIWSKVQQEYNSLKNASAGISNSAISGKIADAITEADRKMKAATMKAQENVQSAQNYESKLADDYNKEQAAASEKLEKDTAAAKSWKTVGDITSAVGSIGQTAAFQQTL